MNITKVFPVGMGAAVPTGGYRSSVPLYLSAVNAGFPSPAEDYIDRKMDLHQHIVRHPMSTFFVRASGDSMKEAGIHDGDLLVVDRSLEAVNGSVVIAAVEGELTVKYLLRKEGHVLLVPANEEYPEFDVTDQEDAMIWGVVTHAIHKITADALGTR